MSDFDFLLQDGLIGRYQSCRLTLVNLHHKKTRVNTLLYARFCMREQQSSIKEFNILVDGKADDDNSFGVFEYDLTLDEARDIYQRLAAGEPWDNLRGHSLTVESGMRLMGRKYTGPGDHLRENAFLQPTRAGSHWIEFFNEAKKVVRPIYRPYEKGMLQRIAPDIKTACGIDLDIAIDRLGNVVFQFPVTLLAPVVTQPEKGKMQVVYNWLNGENQADATLIAQKRSEGSVEDFEIIPIDTAPSQTVSVTNLNTAFRIQIARQYPSLLLFEYECNCPSPTDIHLTVSDDSSGREINLKDSQHTVKLSHFNTYENPLHHIEHINVALGRLEKKDYYRRFLNGEEHAATDYIRSLIQGSYSREILVIDPYMSGNDILKYLYFANKLPVDVKVITSTREQPKEGEPEVAPAEEKETPPNVIERRTKEIRDTLTAADHKGINIEVRMQFGGRGTPLHDRLLILPGSIIHNVKPKVYSLGTSFNHVGQCFHVIIELPRPYPFVSEFYEMWNELAADKYCIFKHPPAADANK